MIKKNSIIILSIILIQFFSYNTSSVEPEEILQNKNQESRARNISQNIRCMVCQNQSIDESNAPLAKDIRILIRKQIKEGKNDNEIYKFLTDRYGDFILLKPQFNLTTAALWLLPLFFLILGIVVVFIKIKNKKKLKIN